MLIGSTAVIRAFKTGKLEEVLCASNCPEHIKRDIAQYAAVGKTTVHETGKNSLQLGELCGKPFTVLIVGIKK